MALPDVLICNGDMTSDIISTTVDGFTIKIGQISELKDAPNIRKLGELGNMKIDEWYCPMEVFHDSGKHGQALVFFAPPYNNVNIGFVWVESNWNQSEVLSKAVDEPIREGLNALVMVRHRAGSFANLRLADALRVAKASDVARMKRAQEKREKKSAKRNLPK